MIFHNGNIQSLNSKKCLGGLPDNTTALIDCSENFWNVIEITPATYPVYILEYKDSGLFLYDIFL